MNEFKGKFKLPSIQFKATWRGRGVLKDLEQFSVILIYVIALNILFLKWAHLLLNSKRLPRSDVWKLAPTRILSYFSPNMYGKIGWNFNTPFLEIALFDSRVLLKPQIWYSLFSRVKQRWHGIFEFFAHFWSRGGQKIGFFSELCQILNFPVLKIKNLKKSQVMFV